MTAEKHEPIWMPEKPHEPNMDAANGLNTYAGTLLRLQSTNTSPPDLRIIYNCPVVRILQNSQLSRPH